MARVRIVAINDVYTLENLPRFKTLVHEQAEKALADGAALLVTLAGDFVAPSLLSSLDAGRAMVACMNECGVTHVVLGNHEDDIATAELRKRLRELKAVCLGTNVRGFDPPLPPHVVIDLGGGAKVGLVGVVMDDATVYRRPPFGGAQLLPPVESAVREAEALLASGGCSYVIAMTHQPLARDRELAEKGVFPILIAGHEHEVHLEQVGTTWIEKAGSDAAHAAIVEIEGTSPPVVTVRMTDVATYAEDAGLRARVNAYMQRVHDLETATLVRLGPGEVLSSVGTRVRQTSMGTLVCNAVRDALGADACLFNGGGIRASREYSARLTYGDVKAEVPFDNEVVVVCLPGGVVRDAVRASRSHVPAESGGFLQIDDKLDLDHLDDTREYKVALVRDLLLGLDHIEPLVQFAKAHPEKVPPATSGREIKLVLVDAFSERLWEELGGFDALDVNKDGVVSEAEIAAAAGSPITADLLLHALDTNRDRVVSREEAEALAKRRGRPHGGT